MTESHCSSVRDIANYFQELSDPRCHVNRKYSLDSVVVIAVMAILAGANGPTAIATWAWNKREFLSQALSLPAELPTELPAEVPCKDVFRNVLSLLKPKLFQACFTRWVESLKLKAMEKAEIQKPILGVDGKTLRRSHDKAKGLKALHSVSVWASELGLSLAQVACAEKSNEITAIPEVLKLVNIEGTIITIDAMGTQKAIVQQIVDAKADYVIGLKGNQEKLQDAVIEHIDKNLANDFADVTAEIHTVEERLHGKNETRIYTQLPVPEDLPMLSEWAGLKSVGVAVRWHEEKGEEVCDVRHFISSLPVGAKEFARAVRQHWGIENGCHHTLDVTFREDHSRIRGPQIRVNYAWLNRLTLSLLKQHPGKDTIAMKRRICAWNETYLLEVLTGSTV